MRRRAAPLLPLLAVASVACLWGSGGDSGAVRVESPEVLEFAARIDGFYRELEDRSLDTLAAFHDPDLRGYFAERREFVDYFASIAHQLRDADFRQTRPERVRVRAFEFEGDGLARVEVVFEGRHERVLRFWTIEVSRVDAWRRVQGRWVITPEKL